MALFGSMNTGGLRATPERLRKIAPPTRAGNLPTMPTQSPAMKTSGGIDEKLYALGGLLANLGGVQNSAMADYMASQRNQRFAQQQAAMERAADLRERSLDRQDFMFEQDYRRNNPNPTAMERNLETWESWTPEQRAAYQEMNPVYRQGPDGRFYRADVAQSGPMPTFTQDDWDNAAPTGGSGGNAAGPFRR